MLVAVLLAAPAVRAEEALTNERRQARALFTNITGLAVSIDDPRIVKMESFLKDDKVHEAIKIATSDKAFFDIRINNIAKGMSNRDETVQVKLNDFAATFIGVARDGLDARTLLTGNFFYRTNVDQTDTHVSPWGPGSAGSTHYAQVESRHYSPFETLVKVSPIIVGQTVVEGATTLADKDAAGVLTNYAFMSNHANDGTNRRVIEYTFREFMCVEMTDWSDATRPDDWVGRDVDRFAGGDNSHYQSSCKSCHAQMDGFRGAFAFFSFQKAFATTEPMVQGKYARNATIFTNGYKTADDSFVNYATGKVNADRFGWRSDSMKGNGPNAFGNMIANSKGFSRCLSRRFFTSICKRKPSTSEEAIVRSIATKFESTYKLTDLAEIIATNAACFPAGE